ncbi:MAG: hypothetical protein IJ680_09570 [Paludibacteraceae bacterium]|nr:hypothetical protein [Paludibacteraceae bacterium]
MNILLLISWAMLTLGTILRLYTTLSFSPYVYAIGAVGCLVYAVVSALRNKTSDVKMRRLYGLQFFASVLPTSGIYMLLHHNDYWVVLVLAYAVVMFYLSFRFKE